MTDSSLAVTPPCHTVLLGGAVRRTLPDKVSLDKNNCEQRGRRVGRGYTNESKDSNRKPSHRSNIERRRRANSNHIKEDTF